MEELKESGIDAYYVDHTAGIWPQAASGEPFSSSTFQSTGTVRSLRPRLLRNKSQKGADKLCAVFRVERNAGLRMSNHFLCNKAADLEIKGLVRRKCSHFPKIGLYCCRDVHINREQIDCYPGSEAGTGTRRVFAVTRERDAKGRLAGCRTP